MFENLICQTLVTPNFRCLWYMYLIIIIVQTKFHITNTTTYNYMHMPTRYFHIITKSVIAHT